MLGLASIEKVCEAKRITLVMHPALRRALRPYGESFYVGACCFLRGETNGLYFLPLDTGGYVRLRFSKRQSLDSIFKCDTEVSGECLEGRAVVEAFPRR